MYRHRPYDFCKKRVLSGVVSGCVPIWRICGVPIWVRKQGFRCSYLTPLWCSYLSRAPYTLLYSTLLYSTVLYSTLLYSTLFYSSLPLFYYSRPYSTLVFSTISLLYDPRHIWTVVYNARSNRGYPPTSPNTTPARKVDSRKFPKNSWNVIYTGGTIRPWSETVPTMIRERETVRPQPASQPRLYSRTHHEHLYWKIQHFAPRLSFAFHEMLHLPRKVSKSDNWTSPNTAPATKSGTALLHSTLLFSTSSLLFSTLSYSTLLYLSSSFLLYTLLYYSLPYTLLFSTILYSTLFYSSLKFSIILYSTYYSLSLLFSDSSILLLYYSLTLLFLTLRSRSYIGSFSSNWILLKPIYLIFLLSQICLLAQLLDETMLLPHQIYLDLKLMYVWVWWVTFWSNSMLLTHPNVKCQWHSDTPKSLPIKWPSIFSQWDESPY